MYGKQLTSEVVAFDPEPRPSSLAAEDFAHAGWPQVLVDCLKENGLGSDRFSALESLVKATPK